MVKYVGGEREVSGKTGKQGRQRTGKKRQRRGRWDVKHEDYAAWSWRERRRKLRSRSCRRRSQGRRQLEGAPGGGRLRWRPCDGVSWHPGTTLTFWFRWSDCCFRPSLRRVSARLSINQLVLPYFYISHRSEKILFPRIFSEGKIDFRLYREEYKKLGL